MIIDLGPFSVEQGRDGWWHIVAGSRYQQEAIVSAGTKAMNLEARRWKTREAAERNAKKLADLVYPAAAGGRVTDREIAEAAVEDAKRILTESKAAGPWAGTAMESLRDVGERRAATPKTGRRPGRGRPGPGVDKTL